MTPESTLRVETPEGVVFAFGLASPLTRALAYAIDLAAIVALTTALTNSVQIFAIVGTDWTGALSVGMTDLKLSAVIPTDGGAGASRGTLP